MEWWVELLAELLAFTGFGILLALLGWLYDKFNRANGDIDKPSSPEDDEPRLPIAVRCPKCGKRGKARGEHAGKKIACKACDERFVAKPVDADNS